MSCGFWNLVVLVAIAWAEVLRSRNTKETFNHVPLGAHRAVNLLTAMSKSAVKISLDLLSNPLCEQDQDFLRMVTALDTAMKRMDAFNQEKVTRSCCQ